ncbi:MAG: hypothetical protein ACRYE9_00160 [Janthinobacterium lividum]
MLKTEKKEINGHNYSVIQFTATEGIPISTKLPIIESGDIPAILELMSKTTREDESINKNTFDKFFNNDYKEMWEVIEFIADVNFLSQKGIGNLVKSSKQNRVVTQQEL